MAATAPGRLGAIETSGVLATADILHTASNTADTSSVFSTVFVVNRSGTAQSFSLGTSTTTAFEDAGMLVPLGTIEPYGFYAFTVGLTLSPSCRYLLVSGSVPEVVASCFGVLNTP